MNAPDSSAVAAAYGWLRQRALVFKIFGVGFFGLVLLIPLAFVRVTLAERAARRAEAIADITRIWGGTQHIVGPVLVVPFTHRTLHEARTGEAYFLPQTLEVTGALETSERRRGIHRTDVYSANVRIAGKFAQPDFAFTGVKDVEPQWAQARLYFGISDLRGARGALQVQWNGAAREVEPGARVSSLGTGVQAVVPMSGESTGGDFALELTLNGSGGFFVMPAGRTTRVHLTSAWSDPSFAGAYLPTTRQVGPDGFEADWEISYYGRTVPPQWTNLGQESQPAASAFRESTFGVNLFEGVNAYRAVERAIKHGVLFIALVFAVFFLFEAFADVRLSGLNYLLVGAALCLFYLGLLALSEFVTFGTAYAGAAVASVSLIGTYSRHILASRARALLVTAMLGGVYAYLYFVLHMEDYALLAGTAALFAILAALMFATRRLKPLAPPPVPVVTVPA